MKLNRLFLSVCILLLLALVTLTSCRRRSTHLKSSRDPSKERKELKKIIKNIEKKEIPKIIKQLSNLDQSQEKLDSFDKQLDDQTKKLNDAKKKLAALPAFF